MAIVVEDGTGLATAETFISDADCVTYLTNRYSAADLYVAQATLATREEWLRRAAEWIEGTYGQRWSGTVLKATQALTWPRTGANRKDGWGNDIAVDADSVPEAIKRAQCEMARRMAAGTDPDEDLDRGGRVDREKIGPLEFSYAPGASGGTTYPQIARLVTPYLLVGGSIMRADRG